MALTSGTRLGPYEILAPLGAGGMGEVYRARDTRLHREVAIKVLPERVAADPDALARFEREARAIAALSHPNILAIHDFGAHDGVAYALTELLEGETLDGKLARGPLPTEALARRDGWFLGNEPARGRSMTRLQEIGFRIGAWACIATAMIHLAAQLAPPPAPDTDAEALLKKLLTTCEKDFGGGFRRTTADFLNGFSISFAVFLAWVGVLALLAVRRHHADAAYMRSVTRASTLFSGTMLTVSILCFFLPPTVCLAVVFTGFAGAALGRFRGAGA